MRRHPTPSVGPTTSRSVTISAGDVRLDGQLDVPANPLGVVVFTHGSGSSRFSPRNQAIAHALNRTGLATLLFDLLGQHEERDRDRVFDIALLARRLHAAYTWLRRSELGELGELPLGLFGASTGAGAALRLAAEPDVDIAAVVSRGGRPDLAGGCLHLVRAPTLLIVGERDDTVVRLNADVLDRFDRAGGVVAEMVVVAGATHLFEEPGTLDEVARLASKWFIRFLSGVEPLPRHR